MKNFENGGGCSENAILKTAKYRCFEAQTAMNSQPIANIINNTPSPCKEWAWGIFEFDIFWHNGI